MDKASARQRRGLITAQYAAQFVDYSDEALLAQLTGAEAQERTAAAQILGERRCRAAIPVLCHRLQNDQALYVRLSASAALGNIGVTALPALIELLGQAGGNQHQQLPTKGFAKRSYPLPRDLAARTIIRLGPPALPALEQALPTADRAHQLEAIDAIGHIAFYSGDQRSTASLLQAYAQTTEPVRVWKLLRAFEAFTAHAVQSILETTLLENPLPALRWEATRSLGVSGLPLRAEIVEHAWHDEHAEVRRMARLFLRRAADR